MPMFKLPLSGDVNQTISPITNWMSPIGNQLFPITVNLGQSSQTEVEADVLTDVASYGKQLGKIGDALIVLLDHFHPERALDRHKKEAVAAVKAMLDGVAKVKERHGRAAMRAK